MLIPAFILAAAALWVTGPRGRAFRKNWTRGDTLGALVLLLGANFFFNRLVLARNYQWNNVTELWKGRMIDLGLSAGSAFAIGLGLLPVIGGFTSLRLTERRGDPAYRAFAAFFVTATLTVSLYTATKAAYLSTVFGTYTEERNMIYLSPLLLIGTLLVLESRRIDWRLLLVAAAFVFYMVLDKPYQLDYPYYEAPGYSILTALNRHFNWDLSHLHWTLFTAGVVGVAILAAPRFRGLKPVAIALMLTWLVAGEIGAAAGNINFADQLRSGSPTHLNWVDQRTHGQGVTYLALASSDNNGLYLTEFWNRDLKHVDCFECPVVGPGPGPAGGPSLVSADGELSEYTGTPYVLTNGGLYLQGEMIANFHYLILYHIKGVWKLRNAAIGVYSDGWMGNHAAWTYFPRHGSGIVTVDLRRTGFNGIAPFGHATIKVGPVKLDKNGEPGLGRTVAVRHAIVRNGPLSDVKVRIHVTHTPVRVVVAIPQTFAPSASDTRQLAAQVDLLVHRPTAAAKPDKPAKPG